MFCPMIISVALGDRGVEAQDGGPLSVLAIYIDAAAACLHIRMIIGRHTFVCIYICIHTEMPICTYACAHICTLCIYAQRCICAEVHV